MQRIFRYLVICLLISGCKSNTDPTYDIINATFLDIVDTAAYEYNTLLPPPNLEKLSIRQKAYPLLIYKNFLSLSDKKQEITDVILASKITEAENYIDLLKNKEVKKILNISNITNNGLYQLVETKDSLAEKPLQGIGQINFYHILYNKNFGLTIVELFTGPKAGRETLFLFKNNNGRWKIEKQIELSVW